MRKKRANVGKWFLEKIKRRDGYKCVVCGSTENICVAHIIPVSEDPTLRHSERNAITLCRYHEDMLGSKLYYREQRNEKIFCHASILADNIIRKIRRRQR